jgi:hypothetical protein
MAKECFCGCGTPIPRIPIGMRSMNTRGRLMTERLAWFDAVFGNPPDDNLQEWAAAGIEMLIELQDAMHGQLHPKELDSEPSAEWLKYGRGIDRVARSNGLPTLNRWLKQNPGGVRAWQDEQDAKLERKPSWYRKLVACYEETRDPAVRNRLYEEAARLRESELEEADEALDEVPWWLDRELGDRYPEVRMAQLDRAQGWLDKNTDDNNTVHATGDRPLAKLVEVEEEIQRRRQAST